MLFLSPKGFSTWYQLLNQPQFQKLKSLFCLPTSPPPATGHAVFFSLAFSPLPAYCYSEWILGCPCFLEISFSFLLHPRHCHKYRIVTMQHFGLPILLGRRKVFLFYSIPCFASRKIWPPTKILLPLFPLSFFCTFPEGGFLVFSAFFPEAKFSAWAEFGERRAAFTWCPCWNCIVVSHFGNMICTDLR